MLNNPFTPVLPEAKMKTFFDVVHRVLDILLHQQFVAGIERARFINEEFARARAKGEDPPRKKDGTPYKIVDLIVAAPPESTGGTIDFSREVLTKRYEIGRKAAREVLALKGLKKAA